MTRKTRTILMPSQNLPATFSSITNIARFVFISINFETKTFAFQKTFTVHDYFESQKHFERKDRAAAVDWLVQIQESFELNHETMYMAVKLMDLYVAKAHPQLLVKSMLQLIPCVAIFIASKVEVSLSRGISRFKFACLGTFSAFN